jgi:hypothetical protein
MTCLRSTVVAPTGSMCCSFFEDPSSSATDGRQRCWRLRPRSLSPPLRRYFSPHQAGVRAVVWSSARGKVPCRRAAEAARQPHRQRSGQPDPKTWPSRSPRPRRRTGESRPALSRPSSRKHASLYDHQGQVLRNYVAQALNASDVALNCPRAVARRWSGCCWLSGAGASSRSSGLPLPHAAVGQPGGGGRPREVRADGSGLHGQGQELHAWRRRRPTRTASEWPSQRGSLFSVNPFFEDPDIIIVDDAHAAENYMPVNGPCGFLASKKRMRRCSMRWPACSRPV